MKDTFDFADMKSIARDKLGDQVPLELFRTIRVREVKCNVSGDDRCEYEVRYGV